MTGLTFSAMLVQHGPEEEGKEISCGDGGEGALAQSVGDDAAHAHWSGEEEREDGKT